MPNARRAFRGEDSIAAERISRDSVAPFLSERGFDVVEDERRVTGTATEQFVSARSPDGQPLKMRVRICWRREGRNANERKYAAAQLRARLRGDDWEGTLRFIVERDRQHGNTHNLIIQRDGATIVFAALIPRDALMPIWLRQRDISNDLHRRGLMKSISKNHAMNGSSPTIWLQDDRTPDAHEVADALWVYPGVVVLAKLPPANSGSEDDTFDDCPGLDYSMFGSDGAPRCQVIRSEVKRDPRVRRAVLDRTRGCERDGCGVHRDYAGFLDVHHILGVEKSDRIWNCVALCPNCHREAHFAPDADDLNARLLEYAKQFKSAE
ncbi:MAG: HNH endonuclease [Rhodocyclales bacterium]|nr:HNH endonuclease [Rhodocyclales bacterium]